jgi:hypothetical protein
MIREEKKKEKKRKEGRGEERRLSTKGHVRR